MERLPTWANLLPQVPIGADYFLYTQNLRYHWARMYSAQLGSFCGRDPIGYDFGSNLLCFVGNSPVVARDPYGLTLEALENTFLDIDLAGLMELVITSKGKWHLGETRAEYAWIDDGPPVANVISSRRVNKLVCESCKLFVASCLVKRKSSGKVGIWSYLVGLGSAERDFLPLINELNQSILQEELDHQACYLRWIVDHKKTGYGVGCSPDAAKFVACAVARMSALAFEIASYKAMRIEQAGIDRIGRARQAEIISRIADLRRRLGEGRR